MYALQDKNMLQYILKFLLKHHYSASLVEEISLWKFDIHHENPRKGACLKPKMLAYKLRQSLESGWFAQS